MKKQESLMEDKPGAEGEYLLEPWKAHPTGACILVRAGIGECSSTHNVLITYKSFLLQQLIHLV